MKTRQSSRSFSKVLSVRAVWAYRPITVVGFGVPAFLGWERKHTGQAAMNVSAPFAEPAVDPLTPEPVAGWRLPRASPTRADAQLVPVTMARSDCSIHSNKNANNSFNSGFNNLREYLRYRSIDFRQE